ncbi:MAG: helix-turn-helix domain-containing protein [Dehalococcoidia bacterium]|nr:helix-turn-helix domain-containing protein [Dehalococcoidia bacterium]
MTLPVQKIDLTGTYTVKETAEILQLTDDKVYDLIHTGQLPFVRVGRQFRIGKLRLWAFINGLEDAESIEEIIRRALLGIDDEQDKRCESKTQ